MSTWQEGKFFFKKKKQKTFIRCPRAGTQAGGNGATRNRVKVFWFFFSKKNFPSFCVR
jgi:hypothetical protein